MNANGPTAKAVLLESGEISLGEVALPAVQPGELLLEMEVCGLCGTDVYKLDSGRTAPEARLGHEVVGRVRTVGGSSERPSDEMGHSFETGDRIVVPHHVACGHCGYCRRNSQTLCEEFRQNQLYPSGFSDLILVGKRAAALAARKLPDHLSAETAVFLEPAACVLRGIRRAQLPESGALVAVLGGGSMGLLHLLVLLALDPTTRVLVVEPIEERRRLARELGAHLACAPSSDELERCARQIASSVLRRGVDAVFDTAGGGQALNVGLKLLREGGTLVLFAHDPRNTKSPVALNRLFQSEQRIVGTYSGSLSESTKVFDWMLSRRLDPSVLVTHRLPLSRFDEAVKLYRSHRALKVLLEPDR